LVLACSWLGYSSTLDSFAVLPAYLLSRAQI